MAGGRAPGKVRRQGRPDVGPRRGGTRPRPSTRPASPASSPSPRASATSTRTRSSTAGAPTTGLKNLRFGFTVSWRQWSELLEDVEAGRAVTVRAVARVEKHPDRYENVLCAIPGTEPDGKGVIFSAHLFEGYIKRGANDNMSGCVVQLEILRALTRLIRDGRPAPAAADDRLPLAPGDLRDLRADQADRGLRRPLQRQHQHGHGRRGPAQEQRRDDHERVPELPAELSRRPGRLDHELRLADQRHRLHQRFAPRPAGRPVPAPAALGEERLARRFPLLHPRGDGRQRPRLLQQRLGRASPGSSSSPGPTSGTTPTPTRPTSPTRPR